MPDADLFTFGMWVDYIIEWNNMQIPKSAQNSDERQATQADFDRF